MKNLMFFLIVILTFSGVFIAPNDSYAQRGRLRAVSGTMKGIRATSKAAKLVNTPAKRAKVKAIAKTASKTAKLLKQNKTGDVSKAIKELQKSDLVKTKKLDELAGALEKRLLKDSRNVKLKTDISTNNGASLSTNEEKLAKQLASEAQTAEKGITIIGPGKLKEGTRLAQQYGGNATDWVKKSSSSFTKNGTTFETHWYENISTGVRTEFKTKFP